MTDEEIKQDFAKYGIAFIHINQWRADGPHFGQKDGLWRYHEMERGWVFPGTIMYFMTYEQGIAYLTRPHKIVFLSNDETHRNNLNGHKPVRKTHPQFSDKYAFDIAFETAHPVVQYRVELYRGSYEAGGMVIIKAGQETALLFDDIKKVSHQDGVYLLELVDGNMIFFGPELPSASALCHTIAACNKQVIEEL